MEALKRELLESLKHETGYDFIATSNALRILESASVEWLKKLEFELNLLNQTSRLLWYLRDFSRSGIPIYLNEDELDELNELNDLDLNNSLLRFTINTIYNVLPRTLFQVGNINELHIRLQNNIFRLDIPGFVKIETVIVSGIGRVDVVEPLPHVRHLIIVGRTRRLIGRPEEIVDINPDNFPNIEKISLFYEGWKPFPLDDDPNPPAPRKIPPIIYFLPNLKEIEIIRPFGFSHRMINHLLRELDIEKVNSLENVTISSIGFDQLAGNTKIIDVFSHKLKSNIEKKLVKSELISNHQKYYNEN